MFFCLEQGIDFYHFVLNRVSFLGKFFEEGIVLSLLNVLNRVSFLGKFLEEGILLG